MRIARDIALAARAAGWSADTDVTGQTPSRKQWTADVLASRGRARVAFEVQLSHQAWDVTASREARYARSGVRGLWLFRQENYVVTKDAPAFQIRADGDAYQVRITPPREPYLEHTESTPPHWVGLHEFIVAALSRKLVWAPLTQLGVVDATISVRGGAPCECGTRLWEPTGLVVQTALANHRPLMWERGWIDMRVPAWLAALTARANKEEKPDKVAVLQSNFGITFGCPLCGKAVQNGRDCRYASMTLKQVPIRELPRPKRGSVEWRFVHRWWMDARDSNAANAGAL